MKGYSMHSLVALYETNADLIERFLLASLRKVGLAKLDRSVVERLFFTFPNLELLYVTDEGFVQTSPNHYRDDDDTKQVGVDRSYLVKESEMTRGYCFSSPYISTSSGHLCVTLAYETKQGYLFLDFFLQGVLERFHIIETNDYFKRLSRFSYMIIGFGLIFFGLFVVFYGFYGFVSKLIASGTSLSLDIVFKPVIALTLGLAVFDLGKTIVEEEVLPRMQKIKEGFNVNSLINFSVSILIALLIEALLVVFKITISDYKDLPYAAWLIAALALLFFVFSMFIYLMKKIELMKKERSIK